MLPKMRSLHTADPGFTVTLKLHRRDRAIGYRGRYEAVSKALHAIATEAEIFIQSVIDQEPQGGANKLFVAKDGNKLFFRGLKFVYNALHTCHKLCKGLG